MCVMASELLPQSVGRAGEPAAAAPFSVGDKHVDARTPQREPRRTFWNGGVSAPAHSIRNDSRSIMPVRRERAAVRDKKFLHYGTHTISRLQLVDLLATQRCAATSASGS